MNKKLVSVIIPTYKRSDCLIRCIKSVLAQTYSNIEIIVVDDNGIGTEDQLHTEQKLAEYISSGTIKYVKHEVNKNGSAARNTGLRLSKGEYINFLDDDDVFMPQKIEEQVNRLEGTDDEWGATYCNTRVVCLSKVGKKKKNIVTKCTLEGNLLEPYLMEEYIFNTSSLLFKRHCILSLNGFDESFRRHQDYELMVRFFRHFKLAYTKSYFLMEYDTTSERMNIPDVKKYIALEEKFISTFQEDFNRYKRGREICFHLWMNVLVMCLISRQYSYMSIIMRYMKPYGYLKPHDWFLIIKGFLLGGYCLICK